MTAHPPPQPLEYRRPEQLGKWTRRPAKVGHVLMALAAPLLVIAAWIGLAIGGLRTGLLDARAGEWGLIIIGLAVAAAGSVYCYVVLLRIELSGGRQWGGFPVFLATVACMLELILPVLLLLGAGFR